MKKLVALVAGTLFLLLTQVNLVGAAPSLDSPWTDPSLRSRVEPALLKQLLSASPDRRLPMIVVMREQAALPTVRSTLVPSLKATAQSSQVGVRALLAGEEAAGRAEAVHSFWIFNGLALKGSPQTAEALARRPDVELVRLDHFERRLNRGDPALGTTGAPGLAWGVQRIRADQVWGAFGDTGRNVVVANMDTGVDFLHPALNTNYRGNAGKGLYQHNGNWFDATGAGAQYPVDGHGHGTHTMGTIAGQDGIGVAPGARWIAVRMLDNQGYGYDSWIHAGFEWLLAPAGDPRLAPQVVNSSWGSPNATSTEFASDLARLRQAGIVVIFAAGNSGPNAGTLAAPGALPGAFAVGATDTDDEVASFSSRGPSPWQEIKPQVAAPGVNVPSAWPGGGYAILDGTSMAAPHVSGVVALMLSANPTLNVTATEHLLTDTAVTRSAVVPNNDTGWGRVDAYAAVQAAAGAGTIGGIVTDAGNRLALSGAQIAVVNTTTGARISGQTDATGTYRIGLAAGAYRVTATRFGYQSLSIAPVTIVTGAATTQDLALTPAATGVLRGNLTDVPAGQPISATISVLNTPVSQVAYGQYFLNLPPGSYTVQARRLGYRVVTDTVTIVANQVSQADFRLAETPRILLVNSGAWYYEEYPAYFREALDGLGYAYDERRIKHPATDTPMAGDLMQYDLVIWSAPHDSPGLLGAGPTIASYLSAGKRLILTGQDVAFWDGGGAGLLAPYLEKYLKTTLADDNSHSQVVNGAAGDFLAGLRMGISGGSGANNQDSPDVVAVADRDSAADVLRYDTGGSAGIRAGLCLPYRSLFLAFGFEGISTAPDRAATLQRAIDYLFGSPVAKGFSLATITPGMQVGLQDSVVTYTVRVRNFGEVGGPVSYQANLRTGGWPAQITPAQFTLDPCTSTQVTVTTRIPAQAAIDARNVFTLTVAPVSLPAEAQAITLTAKAPAAVLLVDHHRWYDVQAGYVDALKQVGVSFDVWTLPVFGTPNSLNGPAAAEMSWYPLVVWFTGYDWLRPLSTVDEVELGKYLDGGGRLMLSSAFYLDQGAGRAFARDRLGVIGYSTGITSTLAYGSPAHPLGLGFDHVDLVNPYPNAGFFTLDAAVVPSAAAQTAWRGDANRAVAISSDQAGNRLVFWTIPFEALAGDRRAAVLARTLGWLGPLGRSTVEVAPTVVPAGRPVIVTLTLRDDLAGTPASLRVALPPGVTPIANTL
ncbi:MAG TPA: S8 family serine peptidase, partial [Anaerolineae bacterium]